MSLPQLDNWQYRISKGDIKNGLIFGEWKLEVGAGLRTIFISNFAEEPIGYLLGFPIDLECRTLIDNNWQLDTSSEMNIDHLVETILSKLAGRFLLLLNYYGSTRIYPDCFAQVSCVYDDKTNCVGSTASALLSELEYEKRFDQNLFSHMGVDGEGWFPAGLTAHYGISRLLPNHYFDLDQWHHVRFWPREELTVATDPVGVLEDIVEDVKAQYQALIAGPKRLGLALTAGNETRALLACAKQFIGQFDVVTVVGADRHEVDSKIASRITKEMNLHHVKLKRIAASRDQRDRFIRRGGHCNADSNSQYHPSVWPISNSHFFVGGLGGEVSRAFFWKDGDSKEMPLTPQKLIARFGLPYNKSLANRLQIWIEQLPTNNAFDVLDLAYIEHRCGPWFGAQFCCDPSLVRFAPLLTTKNVRLMLQLPPKWKRNSEMTRRMVSGQWNELNKYPINSLGFFKDTRLRLFKLFNNPRIILKILRKLR